MTRSEFFLAVDTEFGALHGRSLLRDLVIDALDHQSPLDALESGMAPKKVWAELCQVMEVPESRRHGAGIPHPIVDTPS